MALQKQAIPINFSKGLDTKVDPFQVAPGKFLNLKNTVFDKQGLLQKRYGYSVLAPLPDSSSTYTTTFNGNLTAIGSDLQAYSKGSNTWVDKGHIQPLELGVLPLIRSNTNQSQADSVVSANGIVCTVFTDNIPNGGSTTPAYKYVVADAVTGQNLISPAVIAPTTGVVEGSPRVFVLTNYFIIVFSINVAGSKRLQYFAINVITLAVSASVNISSQYTPNSRVAFDGVVANNSLYLAWNGSDIGGAIRMTYIDHTLAQHGVVTFATRIATIMSVTADVTGNAPIIYASFYNSGTSTGYSLAVDQQLNTILAPTQIIASGTILNITSSAQNGVNKVFYEVDNAYTYDSGIKTNLVRSRTITQAGSLGSITSVVRSLGLASKSFIINDTVYFLGIYNSAYQPTYFLSDENGNIISKLSYSNGGSYYALGLPNVTVTDSTAQIAYQIKDLIQAVNKEQGAAQAAGIYSQLGINLASFTLGTENIINAEIGNNLNLSGGFLWAYDGYKPVEQEFHLWPDYVEATTATTGGFLVDQQYFYVATYEWSDNQGNVFRSAPSIPISVTTTGGNVSANTINVPTLRLTYKIANPVKIVIYRWSTAQQTYYQVTSINAPVLNNTAVDSIAYVDTLADTSIIGNNILYTTGGVLENIAAPACSVLTLFNNRLWLVDSEDQNLLWFSKQVIESTPVEMSDLLTLYVAPTTSAQGATGPVKAMSALDDKLILFKKNALYYINGQGPDNTGANNQYSDAIFITSVVGSENQRSIVFMPSGLMFQSDKGIWLLGRDLSTNYIGAAVEGFTQDAVVLSAVNVPGTNQVRFTLDTGITLMYDYYYGEWGTFTNVPAISSTLYEDLHTFINTRGEVYQESVGAYLDGSSPVLMSFTTSWLNLAGLQGYQRAYYFFLLGSYMSPHKLTISIGYDYNPSPTQVNVITPDNFAKKWGGLPTWGSPPEYGGTSGTLEQWQIFFKQQKCQSFQITLDESYDKSLGQAAGAGLTISGLDLVVGMKKGYPALKASRSVG